MKFLEAVTNVFRVPDLRKRLLFALALLAVYRRASILTGWKISFNKTPAHYSVSWIYLVAARLEDSPSSRWASCPTLRRLSFCNC